MGERESSQRDKGQNPGDSYCAWLTFVARTLYNSLYCIRYLICIICIVIHAHWLKLAPTHMPMLRQPYTGNYCLSYKVPYSDTSPVCSVEQQHAKVILPTFVQSSNHMEFPTKQVMLGTLCAVSVISCTDVACCYTNTCQPGGQGMREETVGKGQGVLLWYRLT